MMMMKDQLEKIKRTTLIILSPVSVSVAMIISLYLYAIFKSW